MTPATPVFRTQCKIFKIFVFSNIVRLRKRKKCATGNTYCDFVKSCVRPWLYVNFNNEYDMKERELIYFLPCSILFGACLTCTPSIMYCMNKKNCLKQTLRMVKWHKNNVYKQCLKVKFNVVFLKLVYFLT